MSTARPPAAPASTNITPGVSAAAQTVPPSSSSGNSKAAGNATSAFPTAAIVCIAIVGGVAVLFAVYRIYKWIYAHRQRANSTPALPVGQTMSQKGASGTNNIVFPSSNTRFDSMSSMTPLTYPRLGTMSTRSSSIFASPDSPDFKPTYRNDSFNSYTSPPLAGLASPYADPSNPTSPVLDSRSHSPSGFAVHPARGDSTMSTDRLRAQGSRSSLLLASANSRKSLLSQHSNFNASNPSLSSSANLAVPTPRYSRASGPPHARHSRIEIVPPQPLAPPPGTVVATDKSTLAFSALSGIGQNSRDDLSSVGGHHWFSTNTAEGAASELDLNSNGSTSGNASSVALAEYQRSASPRASYPTPQHHRGVSITSSSNDYEQARSGHLSHSPSPPLPPHRGASPSSSSSGQGPQSPLDKLRAELEGEAERVKRRSLSSSDETNSSSSPTAEEKGKGKQRMPTTSMGEAIEAYRRGENPSVPFMRQ